MPGQRAAWAIGLPWPMLGGLPENGHGYLIRLTGRHWTVTNTFPGFVTLQGLAAVSANEALIWGYRAGYRPYDFLARVSGASVQYLRPPWLTVQARIGGVAAVSPSDIWVAGSTGRQVPVVPGTGTLPLAAHWDGKSWRTVPVPVAFGALGPVAATGPEDAWAVAAAGAVFPRSYSVVHWNGTTWSKAYVPPRRLQRPPDFVVLDALAASAPARAWVAFSRYRSLQHGNSRFLATYLARWDGRTWTTVHAPRAITTPFTGAAAADGTAWFVGPGHRGILRWPDRSSPRVQPAPFGCAPCDGASVASAASQQYVVAARTVYVAGCPRSYAYWYDGHRWQPVAALPGP